MRTVPSKWITGKWMITDSNFETADFLSAVFCFKYLNYIVIHA